MRHVCGRLRSGSVPMSGFVGRLMEYCHFYYRTVVFVRRLMEYCCFVSLCPFWDPFLLKSRGFMRKTVFSRKRCRCRVVVAASQCHIISLSSNPGRVTRESSARSCRFGVTFPSIPARGVSETILPVTYAARPRLRVALLCGHSASCRETTGNVSLNRRSIRTVAKVSMGSDSFAKTVPKSAIP